MGLVSCLNEHGGFYALSPKQRQSDFIFLILYVCLCVSDLTVWVTAIKVNLLSLLVDLVCGFVYLCCGSSLGFKKMCS